MKCLNTFLYCSYVKILYLKLLSVKKYFSDTFGVDDRNSEHFVRFPYTDAHKVHNVAKNTKVFLIT